MKHKNKIFYLSIITFTLCTSIFPINASAQTVQEKYNSAVLTSFNTNTKGANLDAHIIGWRYKSVDGKVYRRQYNYSREKWIGEWELC
jgi:hypothetical protein